MVKQSESMKSAVKTLRSPEELGTVFGVTLLADMYGGEWKQGQCFSLKESPQRKNATFKQVEFINIEHPDFRLTHMIWEFPRAEECINSFQDQSFRDDLLEINPVSILTPEKYAPMSKGFSDDDDVNAPTYHDRIRSRGPTPEMRAHLTLLKRVPRFKGDPDVNHANIVVMIGRRVHKVYMMAIRDPEMLELFTERAAQCLR